MDVFFSQPKVATLFGIRQRELDNKYAEGMPQQAARTEQLSDQAAFKRWQKYGKNMQQNFQEEQEIVRLIMESRNGVVQAVMQMLNQSFASKLKLAAAAAAR